MANLEKQISLLTELCLAETEAERAVARGRLKALVGDSGTQDPESIIRGLLLEIGVPDHLVGHQYTVRAVLLAITDWAYIKDITGKLYPTIAREYDIAPARVERGIHKAIDEAWDRGGADVLYHYFGNTVSARTGKPTNTMFIARLANIVKERLRKA